MVLKVIVPKTSFAWSDLILDRSRKLVGLQSPAACATRAGGDSGPNFENYNLFHARSPGTGRGVRVLRRVLRVLVLNVPPKGAR